ncbi:MULTISPECIES: GGDEF domain-containing protein [Desulfitobacterium]|uniref:Diguanylate cyclase (GGDEF) domain-containing protein n=2 Tax=Desulfitobacterium dehalogenans TaxID=36854 RepID=I4AB71_DESDJ|nr:MULTISPECIES: GGDEF domain-containing protein [Desulfitobacterium]AFM01206.1 diguanylate cyclase (GGDEF) domain-containing protein [Desulfitobacterium dehalogenans ATCC 51507]HHY25665.1 GGDEF domain-containing protein [Desulfitobacterium dehalogenans]
MVFNTLAEALTSIQALESANTSINIIDIDHNIIYESARKDHKQNLRPDDHNKIDNGFYRSRNAAFGILFIDNWVTAVTTIPILIADKPYSLEFRQFIRKNIHYSPESRNFEDLSIHQIKEMAITDSLTKLYNRRYIDERLPIDMQSSFELDQPLSVLFIDIDYFKRINDQNGHMAGDQVLQKLALLLQKQLRRGSGWVARYGGDEILICLPGSGKKIAKSVANRLREAIENCTFHYKGKELIVTCSIGIQTIFKDSGVANVSELIAMADKNLYRAKNEGRNRVCSL